MLGDVAVFKDKVARDVVNLPPELKLQELLQANKDAEIVLLGIVRNLLVDLLESFSWQYASAEVTLSAIGRDSFARFTIGSGMIVVKRAYTTP